MNHPCCIYSYSSYISSEKEAMNRNQSQPQRATRLGYKLALALLAWLNLTSCHWRADVVVVKNSTPDSLLIAYQPNEE